MRLDRNADGDCGCVGAEVEIDRLRRRHEAALDERVPVGVVNRSERRQDDIRHFHWQIAELGVHIDEECEGAYSSCVLK